MAGINVSLKSEGVRLQADKSRVVGQCHKTEKFVTLGIVTFCLPIVLGSNLK